MDEHPPSHLKNNHHSIKSTLHPTRCLDWLLSRCRELLTGDSWYIHYYVHVHHRQHYLLEAD